MIINEKSKYDVAVQLEDLGSLLSLTNKSKLFNCEVMISESDEFPLVLQDLVTKECIKVPSGTELTVNQVNLSLLSAKFEDKLTNLYQFTHNEKGFTEKLVQLKFNDSEVKEVLNELVSTSFKTLRDELTLEEAGKVYFFNEIESTFHSAINELRDTEKELFDALGFEALVTVSIDEIRSKGFTGDYSCFFITDERGPRSFKINEVREFIQSLESMKKSYFRKLDDFQVNGDDITVYPYSEEYLMQV